MSDDRVELAVARTLSAHERVADLEQRRARLGRAERFTRDDLRRAQEASANAAQYVERAAQHLEQAYQYVQVAQENAAIHRSAAEFYEGHDQPATAKTLHRQAAENEIGA